MGWFNNKHKDDSKSAKKEPLTGRSTRREQALASTTLTTNASGYVAPSATTATGADSESVVKYKSDIGYQNEYSQQDYNEYSEDVDNRQNNTTSMGTDVERHQSDDEEMVMIEKDRHGRDGDYDDAEPDPSRSFSQAETEPEDPVSYADATKHNHLNSLFNGHLMKWKFEAEEGSGFIRIPAFLGALGLIGTAIAAVVMYPEAWEAHSIVMTVCVVIMSIFIAVLEGRFLSLDPLSARAHLRNVMTRNFNILRFLWGRGLLYISAGILNVAQTWLITMISGAFMIALGILAFIVGVRASRKFAALRNSLADESFLLLVFSNYDGDGDGYLKPHEFALLLSSLGMELDDRYTLKAFTAIDSDKNRKISFEELHHWWTSGYIERGRKLASDMGGDEESYRRIE